MVIFSWLASLLFEGLIFVRYAFGSFVFVWSCATSLLFRDDYFAGFILRYAQFALDFPSFLCSLGVNMGVLYL